MCVTNGETTGRDGYWRDQGSPAWLPETMRSAVFRGKTCWHVYVFKGKLTGVLATGGGGVSRGVMATSAHLYACVSLKARPQS